MNSFLSQNQRKTVLATSQIFLWSACFSSPNNQPLFLRTIRYSGLFLNVIFWRNSIFGWVPHQLRQQFCYISFLELRCDFYPFIFFSKENIVKFPPHRCYQPWIDHLVVIGKTFLFSNSFKIKSINLSKASQSEIGTLKTMCTCFFFFETKTSTSRENCFASPFFK